MLGLNPFVVAVAGALVVLVAIVVNVRRNEARALTATIEPGATTGPSVPVTLVVVLALAVVLAPIGIAIAALWGPSVGIVGYFALLAGGVVASAVSRRKRD